MWSFVLLCSCGSASFFDEPTVPTTTKVALSDIVTLKDVQPPDNYGTEAKKAVEYMQSVQKAFDEWGQMMDNQSAATLRNPEAKAIDTRIRELQDKGTIAAQAAENIAAEYGDFALLQRARMESASKDGKLNPDLRLVDAGKRIEDYGAELAGHVRSIRECLEQLSKEVKDMREPGPGGSGRHCMLDPRRDAGGWLLTYRFGNCHYSSEGSEDAQEVEKRRRAYCTVRP